MPHIFACFLCPPLSSINSGDFTTYCSGQSQAYWTQCLYGKKPMRTALPTCQFSSASSPSTTGTPWGCPADTLEKVQQMIAYGSNLALSVSANQVLIRIWSQSLLRYLQHSWVVPAKPSSLQMSGTLQNKVAFCRSDRRSPGSLSSVWVGVVMASCFVPSCEELSPFISVLGAGLNLLAEVLASSACFIQLWPELPREQRIVCFL